MSFREKVIQIITEEGLEEDVKSFAEKVKAEILKGVGLRMIEEQKQQTQRFQDSLKEWEKLMGQVIDAKIEAAVIRKIREG